MLLPKLVQTEQTQSQVWARPFPIPLSLCLGKIKMLLILTERQVNIVGKCPTYSTPPLFLYLA